MTLPATSDYLDALADLASEDLAAIADYHRRLADLLDLAAKAAKPKNDWGPPLSTVEARPKALIQFDALVAEGMQPGDAAETVAGRFHVPIETVRAWLDHRDQAAKRAQRMTRDRKIIALARQGEHNASIARQVGCSAATVTRVIRKHVEDRASQATTAAGADRRANRSPGF